MTPLKLPAPRLAKLTSIIDPVTKDKLDHGLILWFPGPKSFTGEDVCELHVHGGIAVINAILNALRKLSGFRQALPGEFTKRAFLEGKLDLTEVEGLADLIHAETEAQRKQALLQMEGGLNRVYSEWRAKLLRYVAHIEAYIDFSEEENMDNDLLSNIRKNLMDFTENLRTHLTDYRQGQRLRHGVKTVILGAPNVGKSSLFNYLVQRPAAIVNQTAGTTRDIVEQAINISGYPVLLADTAGLRSDPGDEIEKEGIARAVQWGENADLILLMTAQGAKTPEIPINCPTIKIYNKIDEKSTSNVQVKELEQRGFICISCKTQQGMETFLEQLKKQLATLCGKQTVSFTRERHRQHLQLCITEIEKCIQQIDECRAEIAAHYLRKGLKQLGLIAGEATNDDVLDVIFKEFCIGK